MQIFTIETKLAAAISLLLLSLPSLPALGQSTATLTNQTLDGSSFEAPERWWRGNTHSHSWWSDGDAPPELIADWYKEHGYHFLVISDHNVIKEGIKWYPIDDTNRPKNQLQYSFNKYVQRFGHDWVESREVNGNREVRLKTLTEYRSLFEESERFIFLRGEEITDGYQRHPVHMNGVNLVDYIEPQGGDSVRDTIQNNIDAVVAQSEQYGQPMLIHLNHPNFHYAQTPEDFFYLEHDAGDGFFEMWNGHSSVRNYGDGLHVSTERMWDIVLSKRLGELDRSVIYGVAVDDAHEYAIWGPGETNPGRGWIMVKSRWLTPNKITEAIKRGDFYNSTGVSLSRLTVDEHGIDLAVDAKPGVEYTIDFIGTRKSADLQGRVLPYQEHEHEGNRDHLHRQLIRYSDEVGEVLKSVKGTAARYQVTGDEIYVRARVTSSQTHGNPFAEGDVEMAWSQPLVVD